MVTNNTVPHDTGFTELTPYGIATDWHRQRKTLRLHTPIQYIMDGPETYD